MNDGVVAEEPSGLIDPLQRHYRSIHPRFDSQRYFTSSEVLIIGITMGSFPEVLSSEILWIRFPEVPIIVASVTVEYYQSKRRYQTEQNLIPQIGKKSQSIGPWWWSSGQPTCLQLRILLKPIFSVNCCLKKPK